MISFAVTAKLIYVFFFANVKSRFSHDAAQMLSKAILSLSLIEVGQLSVTDVHLVLVIPMTLAVTQDIKQQINLMAGKCLI